MGNREVADRLYEIADLLDVEGVRFKPEAYRRAARAIEGFGEDVEDLARQGRLRDIPGVGEAIGEKIEEYLRSDRIEYLEKLRQKYPPGLVEVMRIPGLGPKTAKLLYDELGITTVEDLRSAAEEGRIQRIRGMGPKKVENILHGIGLISEVRGRVLLGMADPVASEVMEYLKARAHVQRIEAAGSLRRRRETVGDIDILVTSSEPEGVAEAFVAMPRVKEVVVQGPTKATVRLNTGLQVDLRVLEDETFGAGLLYFTGSKDHNVHLRILALRRGLKINEYGLFRGEERIAGRTEEEMYYGLGLPYIEPEMRENTGEIEAGLQEALPSRLVRVQDIRGDLHVHTDATDGHESLETMVRAAEARGYEYVGISDHSRSLAFINGLSVERLLGQRDRVRALNQEGGHSIKVLMGSECDIKDDGTLDYPDEVLAELDYVIASVHSRFTMPEAEMTARVVRAMENRYATVLGHPMARLIGEREPIDVDWDRVMEVAEATGTVLEVNGYFNRLDLNGGLVRLALQHNVRVVVDTDSHAIPHLDMMRYGVAMARRGWAQPHQVLNTLPYEALLSAL